MSTSKLKPFSVCRLTTLPAMTIPASGRSQVSRFAKSYLIGHPIHTASLREKQVNSGGTGLAQPAERVISISGL